MNYNYGDRKPDIYLITIESFRADRFGTNLTPNINELAAESIVFNNFYCAGAPTAFSLPTIIGGTYSFEHRDDIGLVPWVPTLPEILRHNGYHTYTRKLAGWYSKIYGYSRGFDLWGEYKYSRLKALKLLLMYFIRQRAPIIELDKICHHLNSEADTERPLFYWYHLERTHSPYRPDYREFRDIVGKGRVRFFYELLNNEWCWHKYRNRGMSVKAEQSFDNDFRRTMQSLERMYDAQLKSADRYLGTFFSGMKEIANLRNRNYVAIVTSDHGEEFMERGGIAHSENTHADVVAKIPLIIYDSWNEKHEYRDELLSTLYIPRAILGYANIEVPDEWNVPQVIENENCYIIQEGKAPFGPFNLSKGLKKGVQDRYVKIRGCNGLSYTRFPRSGVIILESRKPNAKIPFQDLDRIFVDHVRRQAHNRLKRKARNLRKAHK